MNPEISMPRLEAVKLGLTSEEFARVADQVGKVFKYDLEGLDLVAPNRIWAVDERDRLILEFDLGAGSMKPLAGPEVLLRGQQDLAAGRVNNGFEGIARLGNKLFLAHEMRPCLVVSYLLNHKLEAGQRIIIQGALDINGLDSDNGFLYVLARTKSLIYKIDPAKGSILALADFSEAADNRKYRYFNRQDYYRNSEGLVVKGKYILVVMDGNFQSTMEDPEQRAPLLLIFERPENF